MKKVVVILGELQRDSAIHIHVSILPQLPSIQAATQHWAESHVLYTRSLLVIHLQYICVCMSILNSLTILSPILPLPTPGTIKKKLIFSIKDKAFSGTFSFILLINVCRAHVL